ncbi:MAG: cytochrome c [Betaproteobacteria bacterium]|nr:cytochrome c [Betaproteobacteria bacterium]
MKRGEKVVLLLMAVMVVGVMARNWWVGRGQGVRDRTIPFYTTATPALAKQGAELYRQNECRQCHSLWTVRNMMESVPAPALDGIGSLHDESWFFRYFSAKNPQEIIPSRLKPEYRMPSYASLPETDRHVLAQYMASLKVQDWYLADTRKAEYEKLTGKEYHP